MLSTVQPHLSSYGGSEIINYVTEFFIPPTDPRATCMLVLTCIYIVDIRTNVSIIGSWLYLSDFLHGFYVDIC